ncbi:serine hydrolase [Oxynema aestuarii]|uniref:serine hydrolase n=1 Tax=Oxynema aestuarii TaxID=2874213 RepID=UPI001B31550A|nr:serine hydrolase [Oxynema aestuarii]
MSVVPSQSTIDEDKSRSRRSRRRRAANPPGDLGGDRRSSDRPRQRRQLAQEQQRLRQRTQEYRDQLQELSNPAIAAAGGYDGSGSRGGDGSWRQHVSHLSGTVRPFDRPRGQRSSSSTVGQSRRNPSEEKGGDRRTRRSRTRPSKNDTAKPSPVRERRSRSRTPKKARSRGTSPFVYGTRLLILGVGLGVLAGTLLSVWDPASRYSAEAQGSNSQASESTEVVDRAAISRLSAPPILQLTGELSALKTELQGLAAPHADLTPGIFVVDLDTGGYVDLNGSSSFSAASTIKLPILIAFFQAVDEGKVRLDQMLTMQAEQVAGGSGDMRYSAPGTEYSALETATKMITISDNTATNMLIDLLGGAEILNEQFRGWGLSSTQISNPLPDLEGTNTTSPRDLVQLMSMVEQGGLVSLRSRDRLLDILTATVNDSLLPQGLGQDAAIAHKTGDIGTSIADAGLVDRPDGKRYLIATLVKRPHNDPQGEELIRQMSKAVYDSFDRDR